MQTFVLYIHFFLIYRFFVPNGRIILDGLRKR